MPLDTNILSQIKEAKERDEARRNKFLAPKWNGEDYEEMSCMTCHDLGWVMWSPNPNDPEAVYHKAYCPDCDQLSKDRTSIMLKYSGIPDTKIVQVFGSFKIRQGSEKVYNAAIQMTAEGSTITLVLLYGGTGNGKTHLAHASGVEAIRVRIPTKFIRCSQLLREFKAAKSMEDGGAQYEKLFNIYLGIAYLIIDEFSWKTEADIKMLEELICEREADERMTMLTSNHDVSEISEIFPRVASRLKSETSIMALNESTDYRIRGK